MKYEIDTTEELDALRAEVARLTALVNELSEDATQNGIAFNFMLDANKQQTAQIVDLKGALKTTTDLMLALYDGRSVAAGYPFQLAESNRARLAKDGEANLSQQTPT